MKTELQSRRTRKIAAVAAGLLVVGVGATYTLASWTDAEWVWGGAEGDTPGIGTSMFNIEQNTTDDLSAASVAWLDDETNPGGALTFTPNALALSPGVATYAPVSLRAEAGSVSGEVTLQAAVPAAGVTVQDTGGVLWDAVELQVFTSDAAQAPACSAAGIGSGWVQVAGVTDLSPSSTASDVQTIPAGTAGAAGDPQHYCFVLELPDTPDNQANAGLQGRTIAPAWQFAAISE